MVGTGFEEELGRRAGFEVLRWIQLLGEQVSFFFTFILPGYLNPSLTISSECVLIIFPPGTCLPPLLHSFCKHELWHLPLLLKRWTVLALITGRGRADPKGSCGVENFLVLTAARVWGQELLWCVTAASWGEDSSVCSVPSLGENKRQWLSWRDLELLTVVFSSTNRMREACGDKWLYTSNAFRQFWFDRSLAKIWMLVTDLMAFLGSGLWCTRKWWISVNTSCIKAGKKG